MCDTFVALPSHTASGNLIFGKNSDREPNEAQVIERHPAREPEEKWVRCTYIEIPQASRTAEIIISRPFQMWGAEMGVNEYGVVIGNEAVFTRIVMPKRNSGLTGMDLLRLALERTPTAEAALNCIIDLLETHGQNACGGYENRSFFYHNSFIIADVKEAWILETAGRHWAAKRVEGLASISNGLTIGESFDRISENAVDYAYHRRWLSDDESFDFQKAYSDWLMSRMSSCRYRQKVTGSRLSAESPEINVEKAMDLLATHEQPDDKFKPYKASTASVCMHATGFTNPSQTNGSMVAEIRPDGKHTVWLTGTSMPCLSVYKPFFFGGHTLEGNDWLRPGAKEDPSMWWKAETLHRQICKDYQKGKNIIRQDRWKLQRELLDRERQLLSTGSGIADLDQFSKEALEQYEGLLENWRKKRNRTSLKRKSRNPFNWLYEYRKNTRAGLK